MIASRLQATLNVQPRAVQLDSPEASQQILVFDATDDGRQHDLTRDIEFKFSTPDVARIDRYGVLRPVAMGETQLIVNPGNQQLVVPVRVSELSDPRKVSFRHDVLPVVSRSGCNAGGCHGKAEGQNGFKLSVFGSDPAADYHAMVREGIGRRISIVDPDKSLLLLKGTAGIAHSGGNRFNADDDRARLLRRWITEGAELDTDPESALVMTENRVEPAHITVWPGECQQLRVSEIHQSVAVRCVTVLAQYASNSDMVATVNERGLITSKDIPGEARSWCGISIMSLFAV